MPVNPNLPSFGYSAPSGSGGAGGSGGSGGSGGGVGSSSARPSPTRSYSTGMYTVVRSAAFDRVEYGPPIDVGPNDTVIVAPVPTNTTNCFYSTSSPDAAKTGPRVVQAPSGVPRLVRVRNLNEIGVYSTVAGEGVTIDHQRA